VNVRSESRRPNDPALAAGLMGEYENFIYLISHDLRNSMRALIEVPRWIAEDMEAAGHRIEGSLAENLGLMNTHTMRLDRMLFDLLVHSRIGRTQEVHMVDLAEIMETICQEHRIPPGIRLDIALAVPALHMGERDVMTLLTALFSNALRHRDAATSLISVSTRAEGDAVILRFCDDGPGVVPEFREKIFQAMTTLKSRDEVEGSGMGLAHVRKILRTYGGSLTWVDRTDGRGVGFDLRFPSEATRLARKIE
jgi:signal transduction histidine kinase